MSDNPDDLEKNVFDDDFDLDDFDDEIEESLDDGEWDEFDDLPADPASESMDNMATSTMAASKKKSFIAKYFYIIVLAVIALAGGGWFSLMQMASDSSNAPAPEQPFANQQQAQNQLPVMDNTEIVSSENDLLPMPTPISSPENNSQDALPDIADVLTPVPQTEDAVIEPVATLILPETSAEPVEENVVPDLPEDPLFYDTLVEAPVETVREESLDTAIAPKKDINTNSLEQDLLQVEPAEPIISSAPPVASSDNSKIEQRLTIIEERYNDISNQISDTKQQIQGLSDTIASLKSSLDKLSTSTAPVATAAPTKTKKRQATSSVPKSPAKKPVLKTTNSKKKANWVLRSAQPGQAVLIDQNTRDVQSVLPGDRVEGLGQVTSISYENGLWVVRGTKGSISQK